MTEKRFTTDNGSHEDVCLVDNLTKKEYESNFEDMVSLMNDIWNQTQRFEKHNQRLEKKNEQLKKDCTVLICHNQDYRKENEQLKQSVNNLKDTIIKITIAYQRKYDRTIVDLVDEVHDEDITDLIKELQE